MKVSTQLRWSAIGIVFIAASNLLSVYLSSAGNDGRVVNHAGIVRGGTQRLVKLEMAAQPNDKLSQKLDKLVTGLIQGDEELNLPRANDPNFLEKMQAVETAWGELKTIIAQVRQNPNLRNELLTASEDYFELADEAVFAAEEYAAAKLQMLRIIQLAIFGTNVIVLIIIWIATSKITATLQNSVSAIASFSNEIAATIEQQERTISQQASSVNETTTTMDELEASARQAAEQAEASTTGANQALSLADEGTQAVHQTMEGITHLKDKVKAIAEQIMRLSEQTGQIAGVSDLVADLANQTNMLALNAAVEAARAGENGKGFAVVAGEIRKLADESKKSAEKINALVMAVQAAMNSTVMVTDEGTKTADESIKLAQGTVKAFTGMADAINNVFLNNQQISLSAKQQVIAVQHVLEAMNEVNLGAKETTSGISQVKASTDMLSKAAEELKKMSEQVFVGATN